MRKAGTTEHAATAGSRSEGNVCWLAIVIALLTLGVLVWI
jgi:hypothetical protein